MVPIDNARESAPATPDTNHLQAAIDEIHGAKNNGAIQPSKPDAVDHAGHETPLWSSHAGWADDTRVYQQVGSSGTTIDFALPHIAGYSDSRQEFDRSTGKLISEDDALDRYSTHYTFDPKTGSRLTLDQHNMDGSTEHDQFDPTTTMQKTADIRYPNGTTKHEDFNSRTGDVASIDWKYPNGTSEHDDQLKYKQSPDPYSDTGTQDILQSARATYSDRSTGQLQYEPIMGFVEDKNIRHPDGSIDHDHYILPGLPDFADRTNPDGSKVHVEWDTQTSQKRAMDVTNAQGKTQSYVFDPATGRAEATIVPTWLSDDMRNFSDAVSLSIYKASERLASRSVNDKWPN